jgi:dTMP kinase
MHGKYFAIEGCDGVGKTTMLKALSTELQHDNFKFILTKEPGGPKSLRQEWSSLLHPYGHEFEGFRDLCVNNPQIPQLVKRALYKADSFYNWLTVIKPALEEGTTVISDRSWVSDIAYGSALTSITRDELWHFNTALVPDQHEFTKVIYLDCPEQVREERLARNVADEADKYGLDARRKVCDAYARTLHDYVKDFVIINTDQPLENVVALAKLFVYK